MEGNCFTILGLFLLYNNVKQLYVYMHPLHLRASLSLHLHPFPLGHLAEFPVSYSWCASWEVSYCCRGKIFLWEGAFSRHLNNYLVHTGHKEQFYVTGTYGWAMGTSSDSVSDKLGTWGLLRHVRRLSFRELLSCYKLGVPWLYLCLSRVILEKALKLTWQDESQEVAGGDFINPSEKVTTLREKEWSSTDRSEPHLRIRRI